MKKIICKCSCHIKPKDHKGNGCCDLVNEPKFKPKLKEEYWKMVYNHVDPFRKKGDKPIKEYMVYCDMECHKEWWNWFETALKAQKKELDETSYLLGYTDGKEKPWKELREKIEGMKEEQPSRKDCRCILCAWSQGFNQALDDILKLLNK